MTVRELLDFIEGEAGICHLTLDSEVVVVPQDVMGWIPTNELEVLDTGRIDAVMNDKPVNSSFILCINVNLLGNTSLG